MRRKTGIAALGMAAVLLVGGACSDGEDRPGQVTSENDGDKTGSVSGSVSGTGDTSPSTGADGYTPVSDVAAHAAIGIDIAKVKELIGAAKEAKPVDWPAVQAVINAGGASKKSDGSTRTLAKLVDSPAVVAVLLEAAAGKPTAADGGAEPTDAVRAQRVDKAISVLLAAKVRDELASAAEKVAAKNTASAEGAPHNVDEAWAFFTAGGNGLAVTADKRAADFKREGKVREPIIAALVVAQAAAKAGDAAALTKATAEVSQGLDYIFYLATHKYLDTGGDAVERAEGETFYLGIQPTVKATAPDADTAIVAAFTSGDAAKGRAALHQPVVLAALGVDDAERVDRS